jgi:hypothetical protein
VPLPLLLQYRSLDDPKWHEGRVENISRSGVFFSSPKLVDVDTELEMRLELPCRHAVRDPCRGRV